MQQQRRNAPWRRIKSHGKKCDVCVDMWRIILDGDVEELKGIEKALEGDTEALNDDGKPL